jgi:hypothetical protein
MHAHVTTTMSGLSIQTANGRSIRICKKIQCERVRGSKLGQCTVSTYLGDEGDVGCASLRHLHFEVAVPYNSADPIIPTGGFIKGENRIPRICGIPEQTAIKGRRYTAAQCLDWLTGDR